MNKIVQNVAIILIFVCIVTGIFTIYTYKVLSLDTYVESQNGSCYSARDQNIKLNNIYG